MKTTLKLALLPLCGLLSAADKDTDEPWELPRDGYARKLLEAHRKRKDIGGLRIEASAVLNAYHYFMAREFEELNRVGYEDDKLPAKLRSLYRKYKTYKKKILFVVRIQGGGKNTNFFLQLPVKKSIELSQGRKKTFSVLPSKKKPKFHNWQIYEIRPNIPRKIIKRSLHKIDKLDVSLVSSTIKLEKKEPFSFSLKGIASVTHTRSIQSVNSGRRQISCADWEELTLSPITLSFSPYRSKKRVRAPSDFVKLLERLEGK